MNSRLLPDESEAAAIDLECDPSWDLPDAAKTEAAESIGHSSGNPPAIILTFDEQAVIDQAIAVLSKLPGVYQRGGLLVHVVCDSEPPKNVYRPSGSPRIIQVPRPRLRELLATAASWWTVADENDRQVHPPLWVIEGVAARGQWDGIPILEGVVEAPVVRLDGSILQTPGYDPSSGILFEPLIDFPTIGDNPSRDEAIAARDLLLSVVSDFPFEKDEHRSTWLAALLTLVARPAIGGPCPLFLIEANVRGSGKGLLADATAMIATGRDVAKTTAPRDDEEWRKRITSIAIVGEPLVLVDNVSGVLGSASLDAALTSTTWTDRILGRSELTGRLPLATVWFATGNNVILAADTARRTAHIRLKSMDENPEERNGFDHPHLLKWIREERPRLVAAALTIIRAYIAAGSPDMGLVPWGSFEEWSRLIRNAIVWAGMKDTGETRRELANQSDQEAGLLRLLINGWRQADPDNKGMTVAQAIKRSETCSILSAALAELTPPGKSPGPRSIGMRLHHLRERVLGGAAFTKRTENNTAIWSVTNVTGTNGTTGTNLHSLTREDDFF